MNTTIGKGITITGSIHAGEAVTIAGTVNGDVLASDYDVTVERVRGSTVPSPRKTITVRGRSTGRLIARDVVRVQQSAAVKGDVAAPRLSLEDGATFNGSVEPAKADAAMIVAALPQQEHRPRGPRDRIARSGSLLPHLHEILGKTAIRWPSSTIMAATV